MLSSSMVTQTRFPMILIDESQDPGEATEKGKAISGSGLRAERNVLSAAMHILVFKPAQQAANSQRTLEFSRADRRRLKAPALQA